ncbi:transglycosylase domain-containing protein [Ornithinibacillus halophilus]|uniref:Penicillin-binding protein n=1 Tax=Ornithinibacillus halophilus TaxID=930117 RepID=A0A1M5EKI3_9BACI|nr:transglycosylase domain-containing protein [Ornithinibacillus halophilus]SHF79696.1 penicillin-binding protein [Ornithinibacillus halophilus]
MDFKQFFQSFGKKVVTFWKTGKLQRILRITYDVSWNVILFFIILGTIGLFVGVGIGAGYFASLVKDEEVRSYDSMEKAIYNYEETSQLYFANNIYIGDIRSDLHREETSLDQISQTLIDAVIATEDEYFNEHKGIVPKAIVRALLQEFTNAEMKSGGSTLTQQLIKNQILTNEVSFERKAKEMLLALRLERFFEKDEILEAYLNIVPYGRDSLGRNIAGVQTASQEIFGVEANELNLAQAAYLAGLPQSPSYYTPFKSLGDGGGLKSEEGIEPGITRMKVVLNRMLEMEKINEREYQKALAYDITKDFIIETDSPSETYPYLVNELERNATRIIRNLLAEEDGYSPEDLEEDDELKVHYQMLADRDLRQNGYQIHSTIDKDIYDAFQKVVKDYEHYGPDWTYALKHPETGEPIIDEETGEVKTVTEMVQTAGMLFENSTGKILAFIGGREYSLEDQWNYATQSVRHNGSTMKPLLVYGPAIEKGYIQPGTPVADVETTFKIPGRDDWTPKNYSRGRFYGIVPARQALQHSYNVATARIYSMIVEEDPAREYLPKLGFTTLSEEDYDILSLALGAMSKGVKIEENINAFSTYGNNGKFVDGYMIEKITTTDGEIVYQHESPEPVEVYSEQTNYLVLDMMRSVINNGTASRLRSWLTHNNVDWAGKTGTSDNDHDLWFIATNPNVTFGTWLGYDTQYSLDCPSCALPNSQRNQLLWAELVNAATEVRPDLMAPSNRFEQPGGVVSRSVCAISGMLPSELCSELGLITTDLFNSNYIPNEVDDSLIRGAFVTVDGNRVVAGANTPEEFVDGDGIAFNPEFLERNDYNELEDIRSLFPSSNRSAWERIGIPSTDDTIKVEDDGKSPSRPSSVDLSGTTLSWKKSNSKDVVGYRIFRATKPEAKFELIGSTTETEFSIPNIDGVYHVKAVDYFGLESSTSESVIKGEFQEDSDDNDGSNRDDSNEEENQDEDDNQGEDDKTDQDNSNEENDGEGTDEEEGPNNE